jgi:hypothetical protein
VAFKKYIAMDRHGAELSGELYGDEDQPGSEDEKNDGKMTLKLVKGLRMLTSDHDIRR